MTRHLFEWWTQDNRAHAFRTGALVSVCGSVSGSTWFTSRFASPDDDHCMSCLVGARQSINESADDITSREFAQSLRVVTRGAA